MKRSHVQTHVVADFPQRSHVSMFVMKKSAKALVTGFLSPGVTKFEPKAEARYVAPSDIEMSLEQRLRFRAGAQKRMADPAKRAAWLLSLPAKRKSGRRVSK